MGISAKSFEEWLCALVTFGFIEKVKRGCKIYFKLIFHPEIVKKSLKKLLCYILRFEICFFRS